MIIWKHLSREGKRKQFFKEMNGVHKDMTTRRISVRSFIANLVPDNDISFTSYVSSVWAGAVQVVK